MSSPESDGGLFSEAEEGSPVAPPPAKVRRVEIPRLPPTEQTDATYFTRVPAFVSIHPEPFTASTFLAHQKKEGSELVENSVRWKYARSATGQMTKQSNARIIEWEDGSKTLQLGSEQFEIRSQAPPDPSFVTVVHQDLNVMQVRHLIDQGLTIIPTSTSSATHRRLANALAHRQTSQHVHIGSVATVQDPDKLQRDLGKAELMKERARRKLEVKRTVPSRPSFMSRSRDDDDEDEEEEEEEEEEEVEALDSDEMEALEDEVYEANANRLQALKNGQDDEANTEHDKPIRRTRVLDDDDSE